MAPGNISTSRLFLAEEVRGGCRKGMTCKLVLKDNWDSSRPDKDLGRGPREKELQCEASRSNIRGPTVVLCFLSKEQKNMNVFENQKCVMREGCGDFTAMLIRKNLIRDNEIFFWSGPQ